jgi:capsular polysaccharide biosynthesis protein
VKTAEENAQFYRRKFAEAREADLLDQKRVVNVVLAESARAPEPVRSRSLGFFLAIGLLAAAGSGAVAGFAAERLDHSVHTPLELERYTSVPVLACVPQLKDV